ncbi:unnamed protein product [Musa banksii]
MVSQTAKVDSQMNSVCQSIIAQFLKVLSLVIAHV